MLNKFELFLDWICVIYPVIFIKIILISYIIDINYMKFSFHLENDIYIYLNTVFTLDHIIR